jgi:hypothetical protein
MKQSMIFFIWVLLGHIPLANADLSQHELRLALNTSIEEAKLLPADGEENDAFGYSVSLSGHQALVGAPFEDEHGTRAGAAYIFEFDGMNWQQTIKLTPNDPEISAEFGNAVSLDGNRALVGAWKDTERGINSGSAYIFEYDAINDNWLQTAKIDGGFESIGSFFGSSVSLDGDRALIGAYNYNWAGHRGAAFVFEFDGNDWILTQPLTDGQDMDDQFGFSVSLSGDVALIGAYLNDDFGNDSGSAYIFTYNAANSDWTQQAQLNPVDTHAGQFFARQVSLSGTRAMISAERDSSFSGAAYIYDYDGMSWSQSEKLTPNDAGVGQQFGSAVSLYGDRAAVSNNGGSVYVFDKNGIIWKQNSKLVNTQTGTFGQSLSLHQDRILAGDVNDDELGTESGAAYVIYHDLIFRSTFD